MFCLYQFDSNSFDHHFPDTYTNEKTKQSAQEQSANHIAKACEKNSIHREVVGFLFIKN